MWKSGAHHRIWLHFVWSTHRRLPVITAELEQRLYGAFSGKCRELQAELVAANGWTDHVHLLVRAHPAIPISRLAKELKGSSSHLVNHTEAPSRVLRVAGVVFRVFHSPKRLRSGTQLHHGAKGTHAQAHRIWVGRTPPRTFAQTQITTVPLIHRGEALPPPPGTRLPGPKPPRFPPPPPFGKGPLVRPPPWKNCPQEGPRAPTPKKTNIWPHFNTPKKKPPVPP